MNDPDNFRDCNFIANDFLKKLHIFAIKFIQQNAQTPPFPPVAFSLAFAWVGGGSVDLSALVEEVEGNNN